MVDVPSGTAAHRAILSFASRSGDFSNINGLNLGLTTMVPNYSSTGLTLTAKWRGFVVRIIQVDEPGGGQDEFQISFTPDSDEDYVIEYRDDLQSLPDWQPLPGSPHNLGSVNDVIDTAITQNRHYRVAISKKN